MRPLLRPLLLATALAALAAPARAAEHKKGGGETYIQFPGLTASILRRSGRHGVLQIEAGVDVPDAALRTRAEQSLPRLRDAYTRFLVIYAASIPPGGAPDPQQVGAELQRATDRVLGRPGARLLLGTLLVN